MAKRPDKAVMRVSAKQPNKLINLCTKVIGGLSDNATLYNTPDPPVANLITENQKLIPLQGDVQGGSMEATAARNAQAKKVHKMLNKEILYVNIVADGDRDKILLSGFPANEQPSPEQVPDKPAVKRAENGKQEHSVKIFLAKITSPLQITKRDVSYVVDMTTDQGKEENWDEALRTGSSRKLVIAGLTRKTEYFFRVAAVNRKGEQSEWSETIAYVAQ